MAYVKNINGYDIKDEEARNDIEELANLCQENFDTIEDNFDELENDINNKHTLQTTITPMYKGEIIHEGQASAVLKVNNTIYTFGANNFDGFGTCEIYNQTTNALIEKKNLKVGHANSVCYNANDNRIYLCPMSTYNNGTATTLKALYSYDLSLGDLKESPINYEGDYVYCVSFDHAINKMYVAMVTGKNCDIYDYETGTIKCTIDLNNLIGNTLLQDIAVNDNIVYISAINRQLLVVDLLTNEVITTYAVAYNDSMNKFKLGEIEGFEFSNNGELYAMNTVYDGTNFTNDVNAHDILGLYRHSYGIITELQQDSKVNNTKLSNFTSYGTIELREEDLTKLYLDEYHIKSLLAYNFLNVNKGRVSIIGEIYAPHVYLTNTNFNLYLSSNSTLHLGRISCYAGVDLHIMEEPSATLNIATYKYYFTENQISYNNRGGLLDVVLRGNNIGFDGNFVNTGYTRILTTTGALNGITEFKVNNKVVPPLSLSINGSVVWTQE